MTIRHLEVLRGGDPADGRGPARPRRGLCRRFADRSRAIPLVLASLALAGPGRGAIAQVPPPQVDGSRSPQLVTSLEAILKAEAEKVRAIPEADLRADPDFRPDEALGPSPRKSPDGSTTFSLLDEVAEASGPPRSADAPRRVGPYRSARLEASRSLFDLAIRASKVSPPLAFVDECLRMVLARDPDHAEARRLLGFIPRKGGGWATPFASEKLAAGWVRDRTFGWVPGDWVPHLQKGELPDLSGSNRWLPTDQADALRRNGKPGWKIETEHFQIQTNVPLAGAIAFGRHLENLHQLFFSIMADVVGPDQLPLAQRLRNPKLRAPSARKAPHRVMYFANRNEYAAHLAPMGENVRKSLGIYIPRKENKALGGVSYFFNDEGGQIDVLSTLFHEVSHQLLFESAGADDYARNVGNYWVFEGLGTYFETVEPVDARTLRIGGLVGPRMAAAQSRILDRNEFIPLGPFSAMGPDRFQAADGVGDIYLNYAEAMAWAVFLMQADDSRYREGFLDYARDAYKGKFRGGQGRSLEDRVGRPYAELDREFLSYLGSHRARPAEQPKEARTSPGRRVISR